MTLSNYDHFAFQLSKLTLCFFAAQKPLKSTEAEFRKMPNEL